MRFYQSIKTIELIYDYNELSGNIEIGVTLDNPDSTLSINGNIVEDLSKISHTLGLSENTAEVKTEWIVTSPDGEETVYILRESGTSTEYTQVEILSPASGLSASIKGTAITVDYDYSVTASTAKIQFKSDTTPQLVSETITLTLEGTSSDPTKSHTLSVATVGGTYSQEYDIYVNYIPEFFSFSTGHKFNSTHPGPHVLAGYLTLYGSDTGTGYVMAQKAGTAALDFAALRSQTPSYQSYSLKKGQAQWIPVLALEPETEYDIYVGVEFADGTEYIEIVTGTTSQSRIEVLGWTRIGLAEPDSVLDEETQLTNDIIRTIKIYPGQDFVSPLWYTAIDHLIATVSYGGITFYNRYEDQDPNLVTSVKHEFLDGVTVPGYNGNASFLMKSEDLSVEDNILKYNFNHFVAGVIWSEILKLEFQTP